MTVRKLSPTLRLAAAVAAVAAVLLSLLAAPPAAAAKHDDGTRVEVTGLVTDASGTPLPEVRVVLEASREVFSFRKFGRELRNTQRAAGLTGARGEFSLVWPWNDYYNHFELVAGVPVRTRSGERFEVLARLDVSRRIARNDPMVANLVVENADFVRTLRAFVASVDSDDEQRIYRQMGKPDRVEERGTERSWWYFADGRLFRFADGVLVETKAFDPVKKL